MRIPFIPLFVLVVFLGAAVAAQPAGLKIVVIDGEGAVNIIQQKTATAPVIEVRDRNNLPVPGAIVTFSIEGGKAASFGGANTLSIATNAAGRAAASGFSPLSGGAVQINVSAAFQGQTVAAAITQTNVMTAAEAAGAASGASSASGASGAGAGAGGGMSATTIGIVGAAVAGGAVAATQVAKQDEGGGGEQTKFSGAATSTVTETVTSRNTGQACTVTRSVSGTATLSVDINNSSNWTGDLNLNATATTVAFTCGNGTPTQPYGTSLKVSGPPSSLRGTGSNTSTSPGPNGETITGTQTSSFEGAVNGSTVTGTLTVEHRSQSTGGGGGPVDSSQTATFSLTLTKQ